MLEHRKLHNDKLHSLYSWPDITKLLKSRRIRWGACSAYGREEKHGIWSENFNERGHLEDLGINGGIMLDWIMEK